MPIKIPDNLPAAEALNKENIFIMGKMAQSCEPVFCQLAQLSRLPGNPLQP